MHVITFIDGTNPCLMTSVGGASNPRPMATPAPVGGAFRPFVSFHGEDWQRGWRQDHVKARMLAELPVGAMLAFDDATVGHFNAQEQDDDDARGAPAVSLDIRD